MHEALTAKQQLEFYASFFKAVEKEQSYTKEPVRINNPFVHGVQVYRGIEILAAVAEARLEDDASAGRVRFLYKGVCFYQKVRNK